MLLPMIILIVMDRDIINIVRQEEVSYIYGTYLDWLAREMERAIDSHLDRLPLKAKREGYPKFIWMAAPQNINFKDNAKRAKFNKNLQNVVSYHSGMVMMRPVKECNFNDTNLFIGEAHRFTSEGLARYWSSIDSAIEHWVTFLAAKRRCAAKAALQENDEEKPNSGFIKRMKKEFTNKSVNDKYHWVKRYQNFNHKKQQFILPRPR